MPGEPRCWICGKDLEGEDYRTSFSCLGCKPSPTLAELLTAKQADMLKHVICHGTYDVISEQVTVCKTYDQTGACRWRDVCHALWQLAQQGKEGE